MELDKGKKLLSYSPPKKPLYVAYGDSVSHGTGQKSASYLTWPYKLAEKLGYDYYSLAVGGAKIKLPVVECFQYFDQVDLVTFYLGINDAASKTVAEYKKDYDDALGIIRKYHPTAKIFCITMHTIPEDKVGKFTKVPLIQYRQPVIDLIAARQKAGDKNIFLVDGTKLVGLDDAMNPGNVNLSVDGADKWAKNLYQKIKPNL
jgi:lysophospholipase L1-like esterase